MKNIYKNQSTIRLRDLIILIVVFFVIPNNSSLHAAEKSKYDKYKLVNVKKVAKKKNLPIFYVVASNSCPHCLSYMNNTITPNIKKITKNFLFAFTNLSSENDIPSHLPFNRSTPTTYILNPDGELIYSPIVGDINMYKLNMVFEKIYKRYSVGEI